MTPEHGNIGDHAIAMAETAILDRLGIRYIELTGTRLELMKRSHQLSALNGFAIIMNGGGYLGTLWMNEEELVRQIIRNNPKSKIAFMPNTVFYENSEWGNKELERSREIYNRHKNVSLYAREKQSYELMKSIYKNVKLMPDMVLSFDPYETGAERNGCVLCLRNDREKTMSKEQETELLNICERLFEGNIRSVDMIEADGVRIQDRKAAVEKKLNEFCSAELVVTDRLHGMIFCAVTGTPCIVINSKSPKLKGCYEWIRNLKYIRFIDDVQSLEAVYSDIRGKTYHYSNTAFSDCFAELSRDIDALTK